MLLLGLRCLGSGSPKCELRLPDTASSPLRSGLPFEEQLQQRCRIANAAKGWPGLAVC